jgi:hypothetical protein
MMLIGFGTDVAVGIEEGGDVLLGGGVIVTFVAVVVAVF